MDYQRNWLEDSGSDDSQGRALWALGMVLGRSNMPALHHMAGRLFQQSLIDTSASPDRSIQSQPDSGNSELVVSSLLHI